MAGNPSPRDGDNVGVSSRDAAGQPPARSVASECLLWRFGGEAGIRTLGRTLKALQRFSKPPPSASRPPHRVEIPKCTSTFE